MASVTRACPALPGPARTLCSAGDAVQWADDPAPAAHRHPDLPHPARTGLLLRGQDRLRRAAATPRFAARRCRRTNNDIARYEGFYASVVYSYFAALGYEIAVEESSSHSRLDMAVRTGGQVYLFEFKVVEMASPGSALAQLRARDYAAKYRGRGEPIQMGGNRSRSAAASLGEEQPIHLIGVEFSREARNVTAFEVADG